MSKSTSDSISSNRAVTDEHEASTKNPFACRASVVHRGLSAYQSRNIDCCRLVSQRPPRTAIKRVEWGRKKALRSRPFAQPLCHSDPFFLLLSSCHVIILGGRVLCAGWPRVRQGSVGPTVEHVGSLHAMPVAQSLYRHQPCLSIIVFLSYLAESSGAYHNKQQGAHDVLLSTVSVVLDCICFLVFEHFLFNF